MLELEKTYNPGAVEEKIYKFWLDKSYFTANAKSAKTPYTIMMPPPNITGQLHMGHAMYTLQDVLIRTKRMQGFEVLWMPGTDHASIATEARIVAAMAQEGLTKEMIGRDAFLERAWRWKEKYGGTISSQLKRIGSSCDWSRERFTLDEGCSEAVREVFVNLYNKGLIYRGERIINWCPHCLTSISDAEVEHEEQQGNLWHIRYELEDGSGHLEVATTRPETMLGDTALCVNPTDVRYKHLIGKNVILPLVGRIIPVIADDYAEKDFGTGVVKITPAHDPNDFEVGARHNLPIIKMLTDDAKVTQEFAAYAGLDRFVARKAVLKDLEAQNALVKTVPITHNVGTCYRCDTTVETTVSKQWFVKMEPLAKPAIEAVRDGSIKYVPERFEKTYFHWMENIKDWCISRQLWWGHRIPAYYCDVCGHTEVSKTDVSACPKCGAPVRQDEDTLDTWFSSALWPFSTLGWPNLQSEDLKKFYPTNVLVTAYDIIFFWVARMIFSGLEHMGDIPFDTVFIHGLVRDAEGRKMSKSLGNGIDPIEVIDAYGADALRLALAMGTSLGGDIKFSTERCLPTRNFANKIWNAARFLLMNVDENTQQVIPQTLELEDRWVLAKLNATIKEVTQDIEKYELSLAAQKTVDFIWDIFCDWYIEIAKIRLQSEDAGKRAAVQSVLTYTFANALKLLHPFMPFITEEIYKALPGGGESIMIEAWPQYAQALEFEEQQHTMSRIIELIKAVRNVRTEMNVHPSKKTAMFIETQLEAEFEQGKSFIEKFAFASSVALGAVVPAQFNGGVQLVIDGARVHIPLAELVDKQKELERLAKERENCEKDIAMLASKLGNAGFVAKAPPQVIAEYGDKLEKAQAKLQKIVESISSL